jgi:SdpC family antimicrobial peptide
MFRRFLASSLIATTLLAGCATEPSGPTVDRTEELASFTGEQLYLATLFGVGPARDTVPSVASYADETITIGAEAQRSLEELVGQIAAAHPQFFADFARDIRSGDRVAIRAALVRAGEVTKTVVEQVHQIDAEELARNGNIAVSRKGRPSDPDDATGPVAVSVAAIIVVAAVIAIVVVFGATDGSSDLALDAVSDELATGN